MRVLRRMMGAFACIGLAGFASAPAPMPPNTVPLSGMMETLSQRPGFTEGFLAEVQGNHHKGGALLTPALVHYMRELILGRQWEKLDHFPGWTMGEINPTVRVVGHLAGRDSKVESMATAGGAPSGSPSVPAAGKPAAEKKELAIPFLDLGSYELHESGRVDLSERSILPGFSAHSLVTSLGDGITRGDGPGALAPEHAESQRLADVLNRLSANGLDGASQLEVVGLAGQAPEATPEGAIRMLQQTGHTVTLTDTRYFANFGHLHWSGADVMMPFWINTEIAVPGARRSLLVPVSHAEYEWHIRGPAVNADVSFYFGIDGKAEFRTMDQRDQAWVMKRDAHIYTGTKAVEVTRLAGEMVRAYAHLHQAHPAIPFGGYYAFGVCQDVVAAIELKMTGKATLFPNTADERFFDDSRDAEINVLIKRLPKDRAGRAPEAERIFGSLPVGSSDAELRAVSIPGLGDDLVAVHDAWTNGTLERVGERRRKRNGLYWLGALLALATVWLVHRTRKRRGTVGHA